MEASTMIRRRITLSDQLSSDLRRHPKTLAAILEADKIREEEESRRRRATWTAGSSSTQASTVRVSLMTLMEMRQEEDGGGASGSDGKDDVEGWEVCCVCMGRKKGAAFIPCGHTFCRVCSREVMARRCNCPLCNALIAEVLDIY